MDNQSTSNWGEKKIQAEILKLEWETKLLKDGRIRSWLMLLSILFGIGVSVASIYSALEEVALKNKQQAMEATIRSHEIFLNNVLDRMSGIKVDYQELNENNQLYTSKREKFGGTTQVGAYYAAIALACEFANLKIPAKNALEWQVFIAPTDTAAPAALKEIKEKC